MQRKLIDLGWVIAIIQPTEKETYDELILITPALVEENVLQPAQSVQVVGLDKIKKLHAGLGEYISKTSKGLYNVGLTCKQKKETL